MNHGIPSRGSGLSSAKRVRNEGEEEVLDERSVDKENERKRRKEDCYGAAKLTSHKMSLQIVIRLPMSR